ncbi:MAG: hypothetical protein QXJ32_01495 [Thermoplasmata archaeon]
MEIKVELDRRLLRRADYEARRLRQGLDRFLGRCLEEGCRLALEGVSEWKNAARKTKRLEDFDRARLDYERARAEHISLEGKAASLNFMAYEAFCRVGTKLMSYSGARSKARDLQNKLRDSGIEYDISEGELPEFKQLADRYLFRKKSEKDSPRTRA